MCNTLVWITKSNFTFLNSEANRLKGCSDMKDNKLHVQVKFPRILENYTRVFLSTNTTAKRKVKIPSPSPGSHRRAVL